MSYLALRHLHVTCVVLSGLGFALARLVDAQRFAVAQDAPRRGSFRMSIDSVLLGSALLMAWQSSQYPFAQGWLTAKFFGLLAYILCGTMALKRARTRGRRVVFLVLALLAYAYIVGVALTRNPLL